MNKQQRKETQILAISTDSHADSKKLAARLQAASKDGVNFPLLDDADHKVIDRYGLFNPDGRGWPHPTTYVIDKRGVVRWKFTETNYRLRPTNKQIFAEVSKLK